MKICSVKPLQSEILTERNTQPLSLSNRKMTNNSKAACH